VATVILQATPLVVIAGAMLIFGEKVGWRRWATVLLGLVGVIVIVQPGTDSFSVLPILAIIGMSGLIIVSEIFISWHSRELGVSA
jgi:drug/metabolite transporter (DMT)-like permease